jgi:hypothetical protein
MYGPVVPTRRPVDRVAHAGRHIDTGANGGDRCGPNRFDKIVSSDNLRGPGGRPPLKGVYLAWASLSSFIFFSLLSCISSFYPLLVPLV